MEMMALRITKKINVSLTLLLSIIPYVIALITTKYKNALEPKNKDAAAYIAIINSHFLRKKTAGIQCCKKSETLTTTLLKMLPIALPMAYWPEKLIIANISIDSAPILPIFLLKSM